MPFSIVVAGTSLQLVNTNGTIETLTLPNLIYVKAGKRPRFAVLGRNVVVVNALSTPIWISPEGEVYPLSLVAPYSKPTVAAGAAGSLSGTFSAKVAFGIKDGQGRVISLSDTGPASANVTTASQVIDYSAIQVSPDTKVNFRRIYRTATGPGEEFFHAFDIDDNTTTSFSDGSSDAALALVPAPTDLGRVPPRLELIVEWKGFLWGKQTSDPDGVYSSASNKLYAWPPSQNFPIRPIGRDRLGVTGFIPRRDELGIGKRDIIWKVVGSNWDDFRVVKLIEGKGIIAPDSVAVVRDVARWLAEDGVYEWDAEGVRCISDAKVHPWFTTDTYFNRGQFPKAFARYDPLKHSYDLFLAPAGSTDFTRWVSYDIARKSWMGPHKTTAFTPTGAGVIYDSNEVLVPVVGGDDNYVYQVTPGTFRDGASTAIDFDVTGKFHSGDAPDVHHYWGQLSMLTKVQSGGTLTITPKVGRLDASAGTAISHNLTTGRERLRRLGVGPLCQLRFQNSENNQALEIYGYELPFHEVGRR